MKNPQVTAKITLEEIYFTRTPENWDGATWDHLSTGVRLPAGTQVEITNTINAGFRGIEHRITTADGWKATVTGDKLADEWDAISAPEGSLNWYRKQIAAWNARCRPTDAGYKLEVAGIFKDFLVQDAECGLSEETLLEGYRSEYNEITERPTN